MLPYGSFPHRCGHYPDGVHGYPRPVDPSQRYLRDHLVLTTADEEFLGCAQSDSHRLWFAVLQKALGYTPDQMRRRPRFAGPKMHIFRLTACLLISLAGPVSSWARGIEGPRIVWCPDLATAKKLALPQKKLVFCILLLGKLDREPC